MYVLALGVKSPEGGEDLLRWFAVNGLQILLWLIGAILATRLVNYVTAHALTRIDRGFVESDDLVRSEASKHRHALAQVFAYVAIAVIWVVAAYHLFTAVGIPIAGLAAPATVLGAGLGFGAQRVVGDFLAGFFIIAEKQYGYGDDVKIVATSAVTSVGTVEDVTLRVTRLRTADGEVVAIPNGQIIESTNLSKDWARAVVDVPVPLGADVNKVQDVLSRAGEDAMASSRVGRLLLDKPKPMGVVSADKDSMTLRMVVRTLPGKQFEVSRYLRASIIGKLADSGIATPVIAKGLAAGDGLGVPTETHT